MPVEKVAGNLKDKENVTKEDVIQAFKIAVRPAVVLRENQAHFENACYCLYYGYGFKDWNHDGLSDEDAKIIWKAAFHKMANS